MEIEGLIVIYFLVIINLLFGKLKDFSCNMQNIITNNLSVKHILNIVGVFFLLVLFTRSSPINPNILLLITGIMYILFLFITRCDYRCLFIFVFCMVIVFYLETRKLYIISKTDNEINKKKIKKNHEKYQLLIEIVSLLIVIIGVLIYIGQHSREYTDTWDWKIFWFGVVKCRSNSMPIVKSINGDIIDGIRRVFGYNVL